MRDDIGTYWPLFSQLLVFQLLWVHPKRHLPPLWLTRTPSSSHPATNRALSLFFWHDIKKGFADVFSSPSNQIVSGFVGIFLFSLSLLCYIKITTTCEWNHISIFICTLLLCNEWYVGKCWMVSRYLVKQIDQLSPLLLTLFTIVTKCLESGFKFVHGFGLLTSANSSQSISWINISFPDEY